MDAFLRYERRVEDMEARVGAPRPDGRVGGPWSGLWAALAPHQRSFVSIAARARASQLEAAARGRRSGGLVLADPMGAGKTLSAIAACLAVGAFPVLVLAPISVVSQWVDEIETRLGREGTVSDGLSASDPPATSARSNSLFVVAPHYFVKNAGPASETCSRVDWGAVVVDEAHVAFNPRNISHGSCAAFARGRGPGGAPRFVVTISGTPCSGMERQNRTSMRAAAVAAGWDAGPPTASTRKRPRGNSRDERRQTSVASLVARSLVCRSVPGVFPEVRTRVLRVPLCSAPETALREELERDTAGLVPLVRMTRSQQAAAGVHVLLSVCAETAAAGRGTDDPLTELLVRACGAPAAAAVARLAEARARASLAPPRSPSPAGPAGEPGTTTDETVEERVLRAMVSSFGGVVVSASRPAPPRPAPRPVAESPPPRPAGADACRAPAPAPFDADAVVARVVEHARSVDCETFFADPVRHCTRLTALVECMRADAAEAAGLGLPRPKTIVFAEYLEAVDAIAAAVDRLSAELAGGAPVGRAAACRVYRGGMDMTERQEAVDAYMRGEATTLVLQERAGGQGLNLGGTDHVYFATQTWSFALAQQAPARATRMGAKPRSGLVRVTHVLLDGTRDAKVFECRARKGADVALAMRGSVSSS